ncbi:MAG: zinc metallopeptidase [Clostridia bacterium]|nr:zinc metallopeptidase [Clostridia bacterium]
MLFGWFYYDWTVLIVLPALIFTFWAQIKVNSSFNKYSQVRTSRGITGAMAARRILDANGLSNVRIEKVRGSMTDHFDPRTNVVRLSETVHDVSSVAALGVAAHEVGHAIQYARGYAPIKIRAAIIPATRIGSTLAMPLFIIGLFLASDPLILFGIVLYSLVTLFQLVTLPVEFNASSRAMKTLEGQGILYGEELSGARSVLTAAAMTYVAALATSLLSLLRLITIANRRR